MPKRALITGITGQDGSYLTELLLDKGYEVHGLVRRSPTFSRSRVERLYKNYLVRDSRLSPRLHLHYGDMTDSSSLIRVLQLSNPSEIYNLAAQSDVRTSYEQSDYTADVNAFGTLRLLEAVRFLKGEKRMRIYQASTSELYGKVRDYARKETTPFDPRNPYGMSKLYAFWIVKNYREAYGMYACNGILFNHESERRGENFVSRKITMGVARIVKEKQSKLCLGNLSAGRDWGYAKDYVEAMWRMLQQRTPDDYVLATGKTHTVRDFASLAFREAGIPIRWRGKGRAEKGIHAVTGKVLVEVDPHYFRPTDAGALMGDPTKARKKLGWNPHRTSFRDLVRIMVKHDLQSA